MFKPATSSFDQQGIETPHITMEYSANLAEAFDVQKAIDGLHAATIGSELFDVAAIPTRAVMRTQYRIASSRNPCVG